MKLINEEPFRKGRLTGWVVGGGVGGEGDYFLRALKTAASEWEVEEKEASLSSTLTNRIWKGRETESSCERSERERVAW